MLVTKVKGLRPPGRPEKMSKRYDTEFICGHRNVFRSPMPLKGEFQWCPGCFDWQSVWSTKLVEETK